ncbi:MAG TPA: hypothetical protein VFG30_41385 [Polyangiales bacterium]|nr:hypothetical protein [Polyangiales bacterium]
MSNDTLLELEELDRRPSESTTDGPAIGAEPNKLRANLSQRARVQADLGLARNALEDSIRAYLDEVGEFDTLLSRILEDFKSTSANLKPAQPADATFALSARLGESLRVYIRDVVLSRPPQDEPNMVDAIECSVYLFTQAETELLRAREGDVPDDDTQLAWIRAHRGAARALHYWMLLTNGSSDAGSRFEKAKQDFARTQQQNGAPYVWSTRFLAYLYSLRAEPGDFEQARQLLERVMQFDSSLQSSINRSLAMLFSYEAAATGLDATVRRDAARAGVNAGATATREDAEDYVAAYFTAANWWLLAMCEPDQQKREIHQKGHRAAIESARARSMNAISQALVTLAGLQLMESLTPAACETSAQTPPIQEDKATQDVIQLLDSLQLVFPLDLETRLIFRRDPVWSTIKRFMPEIYAARLGPAYDKLTQFIAAPAGTRKS